MVVKQHDKPLSLSVWVDSIQGLLNGSGPALARADWLALDVM